MDGRAPASSIPTPSPLSEATKRSSSNEAKSRLAPVPMSASPCPTVHASEHIIGSLRMHAVDLNEFSRCAGSPLQLLNPRNEKPDCTFMQSGIRQEWRGKTGHVASIRGYDARLPKV